MIQIYEKTLHFFRNKWLHLVASISPTLSCIGILSHLPQNNRTEIMTCEIIPGKRQTQMMITSRELKLSTRCLALFIDFFFVKIMNSRSAFCLNLNSKHIKTAIHSLTVVYTPQLSQTVSRIEVFLIKTRIWYRQKITDNSHLETC